MAGGANGGIAQSVGEAFDQFGNCFGHGINPWKETVILELIASTACWLGCGARSLLEMGGWRWL